MCVFIRLRSTNETVSRTRPPSTKIDVWNVEMSAEIDDAEGFVWCPSKVQVGTSFYMQYRRPKGAGPSVGGWIGLYERGAERTSYVTYYTDTDESLNTSLFWSKGTTSAGSWEFRYYDRNYNLLSVSAVRSVSEEIHGFEKRFPSANNEATTSSKHPQSQYWPDYLPVNESRLFVMERSKNASLVVYYANVEGMSPPHVARDRKRNEDLVRPIVFRKTSPVVVRWYSWGWTEEPEINALNRITQAPFMGVTATVAETTAALDEYDIVLNAMKEKKMRLCVRRDPRTERTIPMLIGSIDDKDVVLRKIFVKTTNSFIPRVEYADLYGSDLRSGEGVKTRLTK